MVFGVEGGGAHTSGSSSLEGEFEIEIEEDGEGEGTEKIKKAGIDCAPERNVRSVVEEGGVEGGPKKN